MSDSYQINVASEYTNIRASWPQINVEKRGEIQREYRGKDIETTSPPLLHPHPLRNLLWEESSGGCFMQDNKSRKQALPAHHARRLRS